MRLCGRKQEVLLEQELCFHNHISIPKQRIYRFAALWDGLQSIFHTFALPALPVAANCIRSLLQSLSLIRQLASHKYCHNRTDIATLLLCVSGYQTCTALSISQTFFR
jgi:hypothetical protein